MAAGGAGFALGHHRGGAGSAAAPPNGSFGGQAPQSGEGGAAPFGGTPFSGPDQQGGSPFDSASTGTPASDDQLTGLVRIATTLKYQGGKAAGTGMILTSTGEVVTNHHVVEGATKIRVTVMSTGQHYRATVVGTDATDDVAVLQLTNATGLSVVQPATTAAGVGDAVTAVGDAGGSVTTFSAADGHGHGARPAHHHAEPGRQHEREAQRTDGDQQRRHLRRLRRRHLRRPGRGRRHDHRRLDRRERRRRVRRPDRRVISIADDLENGTVNARYEYGAPAFLGLGLAQGSGTTVAGAYPGTPAARAGIAAGDRITRVGSTSVSCASALQQAIRAYSPGDRVRLVWTDTAGTTHMATVTLIAGPVA